MDIDRLTAQLTTVTPHVYELAAPAGVAEYVAWHRYGSGTLIGDDGVQVATDRLQLDIIWQQDKTLPKKIKETLSSLSIPWFEADYGYDDDWTAMRCILQIEVV